MSSSVSFRITRTGRSRAAITTLSQRLVKLEQRGGSGLLVRKQLDFVQTVG